MKRGCCVVEVVHPGVDGGRPSDGCQNECLLTEVYYTEPVDDEVQAFDEEGLGWLEDGWNPHPNRWGSGKLKRAKVNRIA